MTASPRQCSINIFIVRGNMKNSQKIIQFVFKLSNKLMKLLITLKTIFNRNLKHSSWLFCVHKYCVQAAPCVEETEWLRFGLSSSSGLPPSLLSFHHFYPSAVLISNIWIPKIFILDELSFTAPRSCNYSPSQSRAVEVSVKPVSVKVRARERCLRETEGEPRTMNIMIRQIRFVDCVWRRAKNQNYWNDGKYHQPLNQNI